MDRVGYIPYTFCPFLVNSLLLHCHYAQGFPFYTNDYIMLFGRIMSFTSSPAMVLNNTKLTLSTLLIDSAFGGVALESLLPLFISPAIHSFCILLLHIVCLSLRL